MSLSKVMLDFEGRVLTPDAIRELITLFRESYTNATKNIIDHRPWIKTAKTSSGAPRASCPILA